MCHKFSGLAERQFFKLQLLRTTDATIAYARFFYCLKTWEKIEQKGLFDRVTEVIVVFMDYNFTAPISGSVSELIKWCNSKFTIIFYL